MTKDEIIREVRLCMDDAAWNQSGVEMPADDGVTDGIIMAKAKDALLWLAINAPVSMMQEEGGGFLTDAYTDFTPGDVGVLTLPAGFVRLVRVRVAGWHKAVSTPITEDSDKYLMQSDAVARATADRPEAALVDSLPRRLELFPGNGETVEVTSVVVPEPDSDDGSIAIPSQLRTAFIYYVAFLTLTAFRDADAQAMLQVAMLSLGAAPQTGG